MTVAAVVFAVAAALVVYFLIGYPLLLWLWPWRRRPVAKQVGHAPSVSILMAVHNGAAFLEAKLNNLLSVSYPGEIRDLIIVSDGSTDDTDSIANRFAAQGVTLLRVPKAGKSSALNAAMELLRGDLVFFCDVRQRIHPDALTELAANFADPRVGVVTGELSIGSGEETAGEQVAMDAYWRYELWARKRQSAIWSLFNTTGCIYMMRRSLLRPIPPSTLGDDAMIPLLAYRAGYRILADPSAKAYDFATKAGGEFRRRMRTLGGMWQVWTAYPELLLPTHRMWLHFFSHKLGRLLLPWCLLTAAIASFFLPVGLFTWLVWAGMAGILLAAAVEPLAPPRTPLRRIPALCRTFISMNAAALLSARVLFDPTFRSWTPTSVEHSSR